MINILISRNDIIMVIIVIVIIAVLYFIFNSSTKEKFTSTNVIDLSNVNSMDDKTAINTLAQISKSLMSGGLTVPGDIKINGKTTIGGETNINGATIDTNGNLTVTSINIGGKYTLSYDNTDNALKISNGVDTAATPVKLTLGDKCKLRAEANGNTSFLLAPNLYSTGEIVANSNITAVGSVQGKDIRASEFLSADKIRAFTGEQRVAFRDQAFIPNLYTHNIRGQSGGAYEMAGGNLYLQPYGTL